MAVATRNRGRNVCNLNNVQFSSMDDELDIEDQTYNDLPILTPITAPSTPRVRHYKFSQNKHVADNAEIDMLTPVTRPATCDSQQVANVAQVNKNQRQSTAMWIPFDRTDANKPSIAHYDETQHRIQSPAMHANDARQSNDRNSHIANYCRNVPIYSSLQGQQSATTSKSASTTNAESNSYTVLSKSTMRRHEVHDVSKLPPTVLNA